MNSPAVPGPQARIIEIESEQAGQRLDNFLLRELKGVPKTHIYRIIRKGEVRVNKGRIKPGYNLQVGDLVRIPPIRMQEQTREVAPAQRVLNQVEAAILLEEKGFMVLNKPSGIAVHGGSGVSYGVIEALRALRPEAPLLELVHRLDRDTSGCLIIAKKRSALRSLHEAIRENRMEKRYLALMQGQLTQAPLAVDAPLKKNVLQSGERVVRVDPEGRESHTIFHRLEQFAQGALVDVELLTGRTHQIRVHAAHCGHPVAGDDKYGDKGFNQQMREVGLSRLFLHARSLSFQSPDTEQRITVVAPLPGELERAITTLRTLSHEQNS